MLCSKFGLQQQQVLDKKKKNPSSCNLDIRKIESKEQSVNTQWDSQEEDDPEVGQMGRIAIN